MYKAKTNVWAKKLIYYGFILILPLMVWWGVSVGVSTASVEAISTQAGFPITAPAGTDFSSPAVVDLDQDSDLEIIMGDFNGRIWAWDHNGNLLPNFPLTTKSPNCSDSGRINGLVAVGNITGDKKLEIIAGTRGCGISTGKRGQTYAWTLDGNLVSGWPKEMDWNNKNGSGIGEVHSVALGNFTGSEDHKEILVGTNNSAPNASTTDPVDTRNLYVYQGDGSILSGFPTWYRTAGIWGAVAAANVDDDIYLEAITGRDHVYIHIYDQNGQPMPNFPLRTPEKHSDINSQWGTYRYGEFTRGAAAVGDIDQDGVLEIAMPGDVRDPAANHAKNNNGLWVIEPDGDRQPGFESAPMAGPSLTGDFKPMYSASMGDLNHDGVMEIVVPFASGEIRAYKANGDLYWTYNYAQGKMLYPSEVVIGDVSGDGLPDVVFGTYSPTGSNKSDVRLIALSGLTGKMLPDFPLTLPNEGGDKQGIRAAPTLTDIDHDCDVDIIVASWSGTIYGWDLSTPYYWDRMPWPTGRHDVERTGSMVGPAVVGSLACPLPEPLVPQMYLPLING